MAKKDETPEQRRVRKATKKVVKLEAAAAAAKAAYKANKGDKSLKKAYKAAKATAAEARAALEASSSSSAAAPAASAAPAAAEVKTGKKRKSPSTASSTMSQAEATKYREENKVTVSGNGAEGIVPWASFAATGFPASVLACTATFKAPTPIQAQSWPILALERDVIGIAKTGSGKTLGFMMPALVEMMKKKAVPKCPVMLIVSPTRELAMQTDVVCQKSGKACGVSSTCIFGGVPKWPQVNALKEGRHVVVATPGRLLALVEEGALKLDHIQYLILDEADRMMDKGFEPDIKRICAACPNSKTQAGGAGRQTLLFSATWPDEVKKLGGILTHDAVKVQIGTAGEELTTNKDVTQNVEVIENHKKDARLLQLLKKHHASKKNRVIIFGLYKKDIGRIANLCTRNGFPAVGISSNKTQDQRNQALEDFKSGKEPLLVATDVAGRGLDVPDVEHVINYSFPLTVEDYVHRIGRTGRGGKSGASHTFFCKDDKALAGALTNVLNEAGAHVPKELAAFGTFVKKKAHSMYGNFGARDTNRPMKKRVRMTFD